MKIDIICKVVDNYGDAGFCWRLAKRLRQILSLSEYSKGTPHQIRLFCDQVELIHQFTDRDELAKLAELAKFAGASLNIYDWQILYEPMATNELPDVVLETFSCTLPTPYQAQITQAIVLNIEYLSAESWVEGMHGKASLPANPGDIERYFYFPGFNQQTGGLLDNFSPFNLPNTAPTQEVTLEMFKDTRPTTVRISIFNYGGPKLVNFLEQLVQQNIPIDLLICHGKPQTTLSKWLGYELIKPVQVQQLQLIPLPFLTQDTYDSLLAGCDLNWVRGEDSFVRAQWAAKPFIWDIYPQADLVHQEKLTAFLNIYTARASANTRQMIEQMMHLEAIDTWWPHLNDLQIHAQNWQTSLSHAQVNGDLGVRLVEFILPLVKQG